MVRNLNKLVIVGGKFAHVGMVRVQLQLDLSFSRETERGRFLWYNNLREEN